MTLTTRTLVGTYTDATTGRNATGTIRITPNAPLQAETSNLVLAETFVQATLDATGSFSVTLVCTDNAEIVPTGWSYTVTEMITDAAARTYSILVPTGSGSLNIADIAPVNPVPTPTAYLPINGGTLTGPLILSGDPSTALGAVTKEYADAHSGVSSVNGQTGAAVITAAGINADPAGAAAAVLNGVTTTGTAAAQQVPIASSSSAAAWAPLAQVVTQPADGSPISSTTLANISGLGIPVAANQSYEFEFVIFYQGSIAGATGSAPNLNLTGPAASFTGYVIEVQTGVSTFNEYVRTALNSPQTPGAGVGNVTVEYVCRIRGRITTTAAGTLQPQIALGTSPFTGTVTVKAGSYGKAQGF